MKETFRIADEVSKTVGGDGFNNYKVRARLAIMEKKFKEAEGVYLEQVRITWVKVFRIIPEFRILRLTFHRKGASKYWILQVILAFLI